MDATGKAHNCGVFASASVESHCLDVYTAAFVLSKRHCLSRMEEEEEMKKQEQMDLIYNNNDVVIIFSSLALTPESLSSSLVCHGNPPFAHPCRLSAQGIYFNSLD